MRILTRDTDRVRAHWTLCHEGFILTMVYWHSLARRTEVRICREGNFLSSGGVPLGLYQIMSASDSYDHLTGYGHLYNLIDSCDRDAAKRLYNSLVEHIEPKNPHSVNFRLDAKDSIAASDQVLLRVVQTISDQGGST